MDKMQPYEIELICDNIGKAFKQDWERTRFNSYIIAQVNSKKKLSPQDILHFTWEDVKKKGDTSISDEEIERLKLKAKQFKLNE